MLVADMSVVSSRRLTLVGFSSESESDQSVSESVEVSKSMWTFECGSVSSGTCAMVSDRRMRCQKSKRRCGQSCEIRS